VRLYRTKEEIIFFFLKNFFLSFFARNSPKTDENGQTAFHWRKTQSIPLSTRTIFTPLIINTQRTYSFCILPRTKNTNPFFLSFFLKKENTDENISLSLSLSLSRFSSSSLE